MKFSLATLYVTDMVRSLDFYNGLLDIPILRRQPAGPGKEFIFLGVEGQPNLELIPSDTPVAYAGFSIGFDVEDLPTLKARLAEGGYPVKREFSPAPGLVLCFLEGPSGEEVELISHS